MIHLPVYLTDRALRSHIRLMHAVYVTDEKTLDGLMACHENEHEGTPSGRPIAHDHGAPPDDDVIEEWSW